MGHVVMPPHLPSVISPEPEFSQPTPIQQQQACCEWKWKCGNKCGNSCQPDYDDDQQACSYHQQANYASPTIFDFEYIQSPELVEGHTQTYKLRATLLNEQLWVSKKDFERVMDFSVCSLTSMGKLEQEINGEMFVNMDVFFKNSQRLSSPRKAKDFRSFLGVMRDQLGRG